MEIEEVCKKLNLPSSVAQKANELLESLTVDSNVPTPAWIPLALYTASVESRTDKDGTLSDLLEHYKLTFIEFSEQLRTFREAVNVNETVKHHISQVEKRYCIVSPLFNRFEKLWASVFLDDGVSSRTPDSTDHRKCLCWTIFLLAKDGVLCDTEGLVPCYHLLLCCIEHILRQTPAFQLQPPFDSLKLESAAPVLEHPKNTGLLQKLAESFHTSFPELFSMHTRSEKFFTKLHNNDGDLDLSELQQRYHDSQRDVGGLDELRFLDQAPHLVPPRSSVHTASSVSAEPMTPVRAALTTVQQLRDIISTPLPDPVTLIQEHLKNCASSPESSLRERVASLRRKFVEEYCSTPASGTEGVAEERFSQATHLYFRVMKKLLDTEKERLMQADFSSLLNNDIFHRSLLGCACEIVLMVYNVTWNPAQCSMSSEESRYKFPWILQVFSLSAYDFQKVLECFIKAEPCLTREIVRHLTEIESQILDSLAWKSGSPLFEALSRCGTVESSYVVPSSDLTNGQSNKVSSPAELYMSPGSGPSSRGTTAGQIAYAPSPAKRTNNVTVLYSRDSPDTSRSQHNTTSNSRRSQSLTMFFNKVCRLGYQRLKCLTDLLQVPKDIQQKVWTCLEYCITSQTDMMKNRHIDQMLMCSVYGICKVSDYDVKFKDIVKAYSTLPHAQPPVYKEAVIEEGVSDSIIMFYNKIYMQAMKNFILQFAKPVPPNLSPLPRQAASPAYSLPGRKNFYISPLKESMFKSPQSPGSMTPRSRQLYSFGERLGSSEKLKSINETISAFKATNNLPYVSSQKTTTKRTLTFENTIDDGQDECNNEVVMKKKVKVTLPSVIVTQPQDS